MRIASENIGAIVGHPVEAELLGLDDPRVGAARAVFVENTGEDPYKDPLAMAGLMAMGAGAGTGIRYLQTREPSQAMHDDLVRKVEMYGPQAYFDERPQVEAQLLRRRNRGMMMGAGLGAGITALGAGAAHLLGA